MKILKIVICEFQKKPKNLYSYAINIDDVVVQILPQEYKKSKNGVFIAAEMEIKNSSLKDEEIIFKIPLNELSQLEHSIETLVDIISFAQGLKRTISSPSPSVYLKPISESEINYLRSIKEFDFQQKKRIESNIKIDFDLDMCLNLDDRTDGIKIISEANSTNHLSGKFHEYIRFLELAFNKTNRALIEPTSKFLFNNSRMGYSKEEIKKWIYIRHKSVHANKKRGFYTEGDIRPFITRIEQACYEVLFNKSNWNDSSTTCRDFYKIPAVSKNPNNDLIIVRGTEFSITKQVLDESGSYPLNINIHFNNMPIGYWAPNSNELSLQDHTVTIIDDEEE